MALIPLGGPRRKGRKPQREANGGLTREAIVAAALDMIDREGLTNFSVRNLAKLMGVYPTAIYWHVADRHALIADVVTVVLRDLLPREEMPWPEWLRALFRRYRAAIRAHPNVAPLIGVQLVSNASVDFDMIEKILVVLSGAGFADRRLAAAFSAVVAGMVGFTTQEFALVPPDQTDQWQEGMRQFIASADPGTHPLLARMLPQLQNKAFILRWQNGIDAPLDDGFELFVDALIAGLEVIAKGR